MNRITLFGIVFVLTGVSALAQTRPSDVDRTDQIQGMLDTYCIGCHSSSVQSGGLSFDEMRLDAVHDDPEVWERVVKRLRGRLMPPPGSRQLDQTEIDQFVGWMENTLDTRPDGPVAGHVPIQRLTRTEYGIAVNDLLGVEIDADELLPTEIEIEGFDNIAAALSVSPSFLDQYVAAARQAAKLAVGEPVPKLASAHYLQSGNQGAYIDGLPLGTRGGMKFRHTFPADGEYRFTIPDLDVGLYTRTLETRHTLILLVDGREVFREQLGGLEDLSIVDRGGAPGRAEIMERFANIPVQIKAGTYDVVVTFIERARAETDEFVGGGRGEGFGRGQRAPRLLDGVALVGPFDSPGVSETPSRERIFVCQPEPAEERACARRIAENLARRAFRRPVTEEDVDSLMPYFEAGRQGVGGFDAGVEQVVAAVLVSPEFLYRAIRTPEAPGEDGEFPLSDLELASRLSFFLWSQGPDDALLDLATAGRLSERDVLEAETLRMLEDPRARSLVRNFALKWLNLDNLGEAEPDPELFPEFDDLLRQDLTTEIESFVASVLLEDRSVGDLLTASHTYLNESLARHYGMTSVLGPQFRRVELEDPARWGILGKGAALLRTSYGNRTSPVLRGAWVLDKLLGTPPTPPPPDVEAFPETVPGEKPTTVRSRLEQHRVRPGCNQCHGVIDPIGLALENFDAIGRWRDVDPLAEEAIDASTVLPNGVAIAGPVELRDQMVSRPEMFAQALTEKLMMYALGRELEYFDMPQIRRVVDEAGNDDFRWSAIVRGIVTSDSFRMQARPEVGEGSSGEVALN